MAASKILIVEDETAIREMIACISAAPGWGSEFRCHFPRQPVVEATVVALHS